MTRARHTLTLARMNRRHALLDALPRDPSMLQRALTELPAPAPELARRHAHLSLAEVDLSFAGRAEPHAPVHRAIAALTVGSALVLKRERDRWILEADNGVHVGRLARSYSPPQGMQCVLATVAAIVVWRQSDSDAEYQKLARCEQWEVVVPHFVFAPSRH
jgi:ATP-dependent DNA helicase RecQ